MTRSATTIRRLIEVNKEALTKTPRNTTLYAMTEATLRDLEAELAVELIFASLV
jgi:hypothetical protein